MMHVVVLYTTRKVILQSQGGETDLANIVKAEYLKKPVINRRRKAISCNTFR